MLVFHTLAYPPLCCNADQYDCLGPVDASMIKARMGGQVVILLGRKYSNGDFNSIKIDLC